MANKNWLRQSIITIAFSTVLTACGGGGSDDEPVVEPLNCTAPQVANAAGTACVDPEPTNTAPEITSSGTFILSETDTVGTLVYTATATDEEGDDIDWALTDSKGIFLIDTNSGQLTIGDTTNLVAADLAGYSIEISAADQELSVNKTIDVTVTPDDSSGGAPQPSAIPTDSQAVIYYQRSDENYTDWVIHAWNGDGCDGYAQYAADGGTEWTVGLAPTGTDENYGVYWLVDTNAASTCINYIVHKGDDKDPNDDNQKVTFATSRSAFVVSGVGVYSDHKDISLEAPLDIADSAAHWIDENTFVWNQSHNDVRLLTAENGLLDEDLTTDPSMSYQLTATTLTEAQKQLVPHLASWNAYQLDQDAATTKAILKRQLILAAFSGDEATSASFVQAAKVLDDVYTSGDNDADEAKLGIEYLDDNITIKTWAPTATALTLKVFDANKALLASHVMTEDSATGVWSYTGAKGDLDQKYYQFEVKVYHPLTKANETLTSTDPYSVNTSTNGRYSHFVDLTAADTKPDGWDDHAVPTITNVEDAILLEAHVRDVSGQDTTTSADNRGKYLAFTESGSDAMMYLQNLTDAGVTHFHLLPVNDLASVKEADTFDIDNTVADACAIQSNLSVCNSGVDASTLRSILESYDPTTVDAAKLVDEIRQYDSFNWGYDPHHFNVVEGSYASDPEGVARIVEFREMIKALHEKGLRVVLDVVYNHTSSSGLWDNSVLDKMVPGYYHRYSEVSGDMERSTCCENTATEHRMMAKFTVDSLVHWAEHYGFDGFRFDVMGHMPKSVILDGRDAVAAIDPDTYFYGEGWNWGEVANNRLFEQATQYNIAGTKVGTFNDRPRDAIRAAKLSQSDVSLADADHIRLGLAGTLQNYELTDQNGNKQLGKNFGQKSYALTPADIINYVSKHDNETLWDALQFGIETGTTSEQRVRIHNLSSAIPILSQGIPFFQLGVDKMRSKSMHRNTYDFGDWFNKVDYTNSTNNWGVGLPTPGEYGYNFDGVQTDSGHGEGWKWERIKTLTADTNIPVDGSDIDFSSAVFAEFLKIKSSSPLFRLTSEQDVIDRVGFHNTGASQTPGLIVMSLDDGDDLTDLDSNYDAIVVVINGTDSEQAHSVKTATGFELHDTQATGADTIVQAASFSADADQGTFTVPAYSVVVYVKPQGASQGSGLKTDPEYVASPYGETDIYVSSMSDGSNVVMSYDDRGTYSNAQTLTAGDHEFNIGDMNFSDINLAFADVTIAADSIAISAGVTESFALSIAQAGSYSFELDVTTATPELTVSLLNASVSCDTPVSAGTAPFDITGGSLYVRGDHSGWGADDDYIMTYIGGNQYKTVADFDGSMQFKFASGDGSWTTQLWAQNADGSIKTSELAVGESYDVAYGDAGESNNAMTLAQGTYSFTLTLNEDNPAKETKPAGTLIVEQCAN